MIGSNAKYEVGDKVSLRLDSDRIFVYHYPKEGLLEATKVE